MISASSRFGPSKNNFQVFQMANAVWLIDAHKKPSYLTQVWYAHKVEASAFAWSSDL